MLTKYNDIKTRELFSNGLGCKKLRKRSVKFRGVLRIGPSHPSHKMVWGPLLSKKHFNHKLIATRTLSIENSHKKRSKKEGNVT